MRPVTGSSASHAILSPACDDGAVEGHGALAAPSSVTTRSPVSPGSLASGWSMRPWRGFGTPTDTRPNRPCAPPCRERLRRDSPPRGRCARARARRSCPCRGDGPGAAARRPRSAARRACASRWRSVLVPPCTARPGGLSMTITSSSRCSTVAWQQRLASRWRGSRAGAAARMPVEIAQGRDAHDAGRVRRGRAARGALAVEPHLAGAQQLLQPAMARSGKCRLNQRSRRISASSARAPRWCGRSP